MSNLPTDLVTPEFRCSYLQVFEAREDPNGNFKFSVAMLFPKEGTDIAEIKTAMNNAVVNKWGDKPPQNMKNPLKDGDIKENDADKVYAGHWYINASSNENRKPGVVDNKLKPIIDQADFYSGCYARAKVNFYGYDNVSKGVGCGLQHIMKVKDGESLGGSTESAESAFSGFAAPKTVKLAF